MKGPSITPRPPQGHPVTFAYQGPADVLLTGERVPGVKVIEPITVLLAPTEEAARERRRVLDELHPWEPPGRSFVGTPARLAGELRSGDVDGYLIRPAVLPDDLALFTGEVVPALRAAGAFRSEYAGTTLREHLGLGVAANQYQGA